MSWSLFPNLIKGLLSNVIIAIIASDANLHTAPYKHSRNWSQRDPEGMREPARGFLGTQRTQAVKHPVNPASDLISETELD